MWAYGILCPAMVSPNASQHKEDKLLYPDHYLVWYAKVDSGPHSFVSANWAKYQGAKNLTLVAPSGRENLCCVVMVYRFFYRKPMES